LDGGGTRTRCVILDGEGTEIGRSEGGAALVDPACPEKAARTLAGVVARTFEASGVQPPLSALWAGLAGAGNEGARVAVEDTLRSLALARTVRVGTDVEAAHRDAFGHDPGILLTVGTGSMAWGKDSRGRVARAGGWGSLLGEEGSGYWMALHGLKAVVRSRDGRGQETRLAPLLQERLGTTDPQALVRWAGSASKSDIAALAPLLLQAAEEGDGPAREVRTQALEELCLDVLTVQTALGSSERSLPVALSGGLVEAGSSFRELLILELTRAGASCLPVSVSPVRGAARLALELLQPPSPARPL
jgi:N-acetylglucosamine kinase-like BadF-type ATPase